MKKLKNHKWKPKIKNKYSINIKSNKVFNQTKVLKKILKKVHKKILKLMKIKKNDLSINLKLYI